MNMMFMNIIRSNDWINFFLHDEYFSQYFGISFLLMWLTIFIYQASKCFTIYIWNTYQLSFI